jgi:hypothetical protein
MTYAETRDDETMFRLGPAIDAFIAQCQKPADPDSPCARQTVFFFPGGMASRLMRATQKYVDGATGPAPRFNYDTVWMKPATLFGGATAPAHSGTRATTSSSPTRRLILPGVSRTPA